MLRHRSGIIGLPLRLLAREVYERLTARLGEARVALVTGEEKRVPSNPSYWVCTTESMPASLDVDFVCVDEIQMAGHPQRGHAFTERLLRARGLRETWFLGAESIRPALEALVPTAEIDRMPRLSTLRYGGPISLGALPPRTAVVAFSMSEVYELAERLRQAHGGTAVVLGALSPRARNAQVAMYESGEVDYMVATDAIGMGLNLDLDRVVFASRQKFDGKELRPLELGEIGQIAGRAGRYTRDGGFGVLRSVPEFSPSTVAALEQHRFPPLRALVWRNPDLDFSSIERLLASLRARPNRPWLRLIEHAEDYDALMALSRREEVVSRCSSPARVELLWAVCRIPDFRKLLVGTHVELLEQIFTQLSGSAEVLDPEWMARRIEHLDDLEGSIDGLMNRMSFIRTWTYITHQEGWIRDASYWQGRTRAIEDRQSDALHARLTERFVDRVSSPRRHRAPPRARPRRANVEPEGAARARTLSHPFESLAMLARHVEPADEDIAPDGWAEAVIEASHGALEISAEARLWFEGEPIATLRKGADVLHPEILVQAREGLGAGAARRIHRRLLAWIRDSVRGLVDGEISFETLDLSAAARGVVYQLQQGLGCVDVRDVGAQLDRLTARDRQALAASAVVLGPVGVFLQPRFEDSSQSLRRALWSAFEAEPAPVLERAPTDAAIPADPARSRVAYARLGHLLRGGLVLPVEPLHAMADEILARTRRGPVPIHPSFGAPMGLREGELAAVLRDLGLESDGRGRWIYRPRRRRR